METTKHQKRIVIIGGYGAVGAQIAELLTGKAEVVIAGRDASKAAGLIRKLNCSFSYIDVTKSDTFPNALSGADMVVNCYIAPDGVNAAVANYMARQGSIYLDVAGIPIEHLRAVKALHLEAQLSGALLVTGLGVNPGLAGLLVCRQAAEMDETHESDVFFTMGSKLDELTVLSLQGMAAMIQTPPKVWCGGKWKEPVKNGLRKYVDTPINRKVFFGPAMITPDMENLPARMQIKNFRFWSGVESLWQSLVMLLSIKWGRADTRQGAERLLKRLQRVGNKPWFAEAVNLTVVSSGIKAGRKLKFESRMYCSEVYATAIAPVVACEYLLERGIPKAGAFFPNEIFNEEAFFKLLKKYPIHLEDIQTK